MRKRVHYPQLTSLPPDWVKKQIAIFIAEDMPTGDITTELTIRCDSIASGKFIAMESFIFCGESVLPYCFPGSIQVELRVNDGDHVDKGAVLAQIEGSTAIILSTERVILNLLQHICGIATATNRFLKLDLPQDFKIMDTRKTIPGLKRFEKYAVCVGGGANHRLDLSSGILIKDNHLACSGGVTAAVQKARSGNHTGLPIELEVDTLEQLQEGLAAGADGFLLDNMSPDTVKNAVRMIRSRGGEKIFIEASGGITYDNIEMYASTGVDAISTSALTLHAKPVDIKLDIHYNED